MEKIVSAAQMKDIDHQMISRMEMPGCILMEHAALAVCEQIDSCYRRSVSRIAVFCGNGNNGGDGFAAARLLKQKGFLPEVFFTGRKTSMTEDCAAQARLWKNIGGIVYEKEEWKDWNPEPYDLILDAILGIGLTRDVQGDLADLFDRISHCAKPVVAVDIPSGIDADTGHVRGAAIKAEQTVTFTCYKAGQILYPGREFCGILTLTDIGIPGSLTEYTDPQVFSLTAGDLGDLLPERFKRSNKGTYGKALMIGGCCGMAGAVLLSASAAYRTGTGLVQICSDSSNRTVLQSALPEAVFLSWENRELMMDKVQQANAVAVGPGMGTDDQKKEMLSWLIRNYEGPLILDADALNAIASCPDLLAAENRSLHEDQECSSGQLIITPHPGEMSRLTGKSVQEILDHTAECASEFAREHHLICVLKDACSVVTDGRRLCLNRSGCSGMSTGGSGDVLTGIICALAAQGMDAYNAACVGVYLHGLAGEAAQKELGSRSMTSLDIVRYLSAVLKEY